MPELNDESNAMRLIRRDDRHAAQRTLQRRAIGDRDAVVVARNDLVVVRIRPFDQTGKHRGERRAEAEVVFALGDLELLVLGKQLGESARALSAGRSDRSAERRRT